MENLDALTQEELESHMLVFMKLASYAALKASAMRYRAAGNIDDALGRERQCEALYSRLPDWARW